MPEKDVRPSFNGMMMEPVKDEDQTNSIQDNSDITYSTPPTADHRSTTFRIRVDDVPLKEDEEFRNTFLNPRNNQRPSPGEMIEPVMDDCPRSDDDNNNEMKSDEWAKEANQSGGGLPSCDLAAESRNPSLSILPQLYRTVAVMTIIADAIAKIAVLSATIHKSKTKKLLHSMIIIFILVPSTVAGVTDNADSSSVSSIVVDHAIASTVAVLTVTNQTVGAKAN